MTFDEMVKIEPKLGDLLKEAQEQHNNKKFICANAVWYGYDGFPGIRNRLIDIVGYFAEKPDLKYGYDLAYETIYNALPNCKRKKCGSLMCGCG